MSGTQRTVVVAGLIAGLVVAIAVVRSRSSKDAPPADRPSHGDPGVTGATGAAGASSADPAAGPATVASADHTPELPAAGTVAGARRRGVSGFETPGALATIPTGYELTRNGGRVFVNLAGGASSKYAAGVVDPAPTRAATGHVIDAAGNPVAGALVLADDRLDIMGGDLMAAAGATSDDRGEFMLDAAPAARAFAIALHPSGWSDLVELGKGPLVLRMRGRGALSGRGTYNGKGESFALFLQTRPTSALRIHYESDPDGRFTIASLPPGTYTVSIGLAQEITGGVSKQLEREVTITAGEVTKLEVAQTAATVVVATPRPPDGYAPAMIEYWMFSGAAPGDVAAARTRAAAEHPPQLLFGGQDAMTPNQFHDVAAGAYSLCAAADGSKLFGCVSFAVRDGEAVREVDVRLVAPVMHD